MTVRLTPFSGLRQRYAKLAEVLGVSVKVLDVAQIDPSSTPDAAAARLKRLVGPRAWRSAAASGTSLRASIVLLRALRRRAEGDEPEETLPPPRKISPLLAKKRRPPPPDDEDEEPDEDIEEPEPDPDAEEDEDEDEDEDAERRPARKAKKADPAKEAVVSRLVARGMSRAKALAAYDASGFEERPTPTKPQTERDRVIDRMLARQGIADPRARAVKRRELAAVYDSQFPTRVRKS